ncbi:MAG: 3-dehydroquinate dehydratase-2 [Cyclobacteriaceae bacterium]|jgi:3-dehydroquinate dehydratase-2
MQIAIVNGPNLNLLGKREVEIYGDQSFDQYFEGLVKEYSSHELIYFQSNHEGELIDFIQERGFEVDGIVLNPAGFSHSSIALADAVAAVPASVVEVHISNIFKREIFRHHSYISAVAVGVMSGFGLEGYRMALSFLAQKS